MPVQFRSAGTLCNLLNFNQDYVIANIIKVTKEFKEKCLQFDINTANDLIITCLTNNNDYNMIKQLNLVTYSGPLYDVDKIN